MSDVVTKSVAELRTIVERHFPVYDVQFDENVAAFFVNVDAASLEPSFDALRSELKPEGLVPILRFQGAEHQIYVVHRQERKFRSNVVNLVLFLATWLTTTFAGASHWFFYTHTDLDVATVTRSEFLARMYLDPTNWAMGFVFFALPLMFILGVHEMGHYYYTRRHGMQASLPFFIPFPGGSPDIGTLGAFISMREPIPHRKALLDIGASGPLAGFVVAIPVLILGFFLMKMDPVNVELGREGVVTIGTPLLYNLLATPFGFTDSQFIHPTAFAGWVGLFVTAINLLPAGQLDGGHIATAMFGDRARWLSYGTVVLLTILGFGIPAFAIPGTGLEFGGLAGYSGWIIFAILVLFLGATHPPTLNSVSPLDGQRWIVGLVTFSLIILCFTPVPLSG